MSKPTTEQLKEILGKRVKFLQQPYGSQPYYVVGTVIGVYMDHPCQQKELKIFSDQILEKRGYTYKMYSEVKMIETVRAYCYESLAHGTYTWITTDGEMTGMKRVPALDMEKEIV